MSGEPIEGVKNGVQMLLSALRGDPYALESVYLSVITFDSAANQVVPLTELAMFQAPSIAANGTTQLGEALSLVARQADTEVQKSTPEAKGDWKPLVFIMTDGAPTDDWQRGLQDFRQRNWGIVVACAVGAGADETVLKQITESVVKLDTADSATIAAYFKWVSASVSAGSRSVDAGTDVAGLDQLPPPPPEISVLPV
jgi:uncharacterized protein YegL